MNKALRNATPEKLEELETVVLDGISSIHKTLKNLKEAAKISPSLQEHIDASREDLEAYIGYLRIIQTLRQMKQTSNKANYDN